MKRTLCLVLVLCCVCSLFGGCRIPLPTPTETPTAAMTAMALTRRFSGYTESDGMLFAFATTPQLTAADSYTFSYIENYDSPLIFCEADGEGNPPRELCRVEQRDSMANFMLASYASVLWTLEHGEAGLFLQKIDLTNGTVMDERDITAVFDAQLFTAELIAAKDGVYLASEEKGEDDNIISLRYIDAASGALSAPYVFDRTTIPPFLTLGDGRVAAIDYETRTLLPFAVGTVTPETVLTVVGDIQPEVYLNGDAGGLFYYVAGGALYGDGNEPLLYLPMQGVNVKAESIKDVRVENGAYSFLIYERDEAGVYTLGLYTLTPCNAADAPPVLSVVGYLIEDNIHRAVAQFNRTYFTHTAVVEDYEQYDERSGGVKLTFSQHEGVTKLNTELMAGKAADVLILNNYVSAAVLAQQGALLDLYTLMDRDTEVNRDTFVPYILEKTERDGHLYHISTAFGIETMLTDTAVIGNYPSLSITDWAALKQAFPTATVSDMSQEHFLSALINTATRDFISADRKTCTFNSSVFVQYLNALAGQYSADELTSMLLNGEEDLHANLATVRSGEFLLWRYYVRNFSFYQRVLANFEGEVQFSGFACENGTGHVLEFANTLGIFQNSQHTDAAWNFLKMVFKENTLGMNEGMIEQPGFPCDRQSFEAQLAYYRDPANFEGTTFEGYPTAALTDEDVSRLYAIIEGAIPTAAEDRTMFEIVYIEVFYFLGGDCTAEEAAARIQERMQLYLNEQA